MDNATAALAQMNMILHDCPTADIWKDNTLSTPALQGCRRRPQDLRLRRRQSALLHQGLEQRLQPGRGRIPPLRRTASRRRRTATTPSCCTSSPRSRAPARARSFCPHGVLFRGNAEADIRREHRRARATSRASSACPPTCSTAPASPPASSCSTRRTPPPARASS